MTVSRLVGWSQVWSWTVFNSPVSCVQGHLSLPTVLNFRTIGNVLLVLAGKADSITDNRFSVVVDSYNFILALNL